MLEIRDLEVGYGELTILEGINFQAKDGELIAMIGANGAGKTTLLKTIAGLIPPRRGEIVYDGERIDHLPPHKRVGMGIVYVPEGKRPFPYLTVKENLELGAFNPRARGELLKKLEYVYGLFPILKDRSDQLAITLSGGEQQMLAIARGLMSNPKLLMLDEPSFGLAPKIVASIFDVIDKLHRELELTVILVEQNARRALEMADRAYVLETGRIVLEGAGKELLQDDRVRRAYLGI
ncbi:MAG: ABC transporter ATP-binding protein [Candidatus Bathyarchaeia archaeon]